MRLLLLLLFVAPAFAQPADSVVVTDAHYRIFAANGTPRTLDELVSSLQAVDVVFVGEQHDDPVAHVLEKEILRLAHERYGSERPVVLSLEMIEQDAQLVLDEYLAGLIRERDFLAASRPWRNYQSDYRPLVEYARENSLPVIAANAPGRYVSRVGRLGPEALAEVSAEARAWLPPLPYAPASERYTRKFYQAMGMPMPSDTSAAPAGVPGHNTAFTLAAQALRDAAMAHAIAEHLMAQPDALVVHVNGSFHSESGLGVPEHLRLYRPGTRAVTVTLRVSDTFPNLSDDDPERGDFIILTDPSLPRTYSTGS